MNNKIEEFIAIMNESKNAVFFGGAGVSTESGFPDFRSADGLYYQKWNYPPEEILSHTFFYSKTKEFYKFYIEKLLPLNIQPNITHFKLAELEQKGILKAVITQNIDGLHQKAGSKIVYELHGSTLRNYCTKCNSFYSEEKIRQSKNTTERIPLCDKCGGLIKPDVVLYEEPLDSSIMTNAINSIRNADTLIIGGTSLSVYPASGLIDYFEDRKSVVINKTPTNQDHYANLVINDSLGKVFSSL